MRWGFGCDLFHIDHRSIVGRSDGFDNSLKLAIGDNRSGLNQREDVAETLSRVLHIKVHVGIATVGDGQIGHRSLHTLGHKHSHWAVLALASVDNGLCQAAGLHIKFVKGNFTLTIGDGVSFWKLSNSLHEILNQIDFHCKYNYVILIKNHVSIPITKSPQGGITRIFQLFCFVFKGNMSVSIMYKTHPF